MKPTAEQANRMIANFVFGRALLDGVKTELPRHPSDRMDRTTLCDDPRYLSGTRNDDAAPLLSDYLPRGRYPR